MWLSATCLLFYLVTISGLFTLETKLRFIMSFCQQLSCKDMTLLDISAYRNGPTKEFEEWQLLKFISQQYVKLSISSIHNWPSCELAHHAGRNVLLVLVYDTSLQQTEFLKKCSEKQGFSKRNTWLLITKDMESSQFLNTLSQLNIHISSNVFIAMQSEEQGIGLQLIEIYNLAGFQYHVLKTWQTGETNFSFPMPSYKYNRQNKRGNLQGHQIKTTAVSAIKFYTEIKNVDGQYQVVGGYNGEVFKTLAQSLNFTYSIKFHHGYSYGNTPTGNSTTWSGLIGDIQQHQADMSACELSLTAERLEAIDYTIPIYTTVRRLYLQEGIKELDMNWYFRPFKRSTWIALIASLILFTSVSTLFHQAVYKFAGARKRIGGLSNFFTIISIMLQQGTEFPRHMSLRLVLESCVLLFIIVHVAYSAKLTSIATTYRPPPLIQQLEDILHNGKVRFGLVEGSLEYNKFKAAKKNSIFDQLWKTKLEPFTNHLVKDFRAGLSAVLGESHFVFMCPEDACVDTLQTSFTPSQACKVQALPQIYFQGGLGFALQSNSPYKEIINYSLMRMKGSGILQRLELQWIPQPKECLKTFEIVTEWLDIIPPITAYIAALFLSLCILLVERLSHKQNL